MVSATLFPPILTQHLNTSPWLRETSVHRDSGSALAAWAGGGPAGLQEASPGTRRPGGRKMKFNNTARAIGKPRCPLDIAHLLAPSV